MILLQNFVSLNTGGTTPKVKLQKPGKGRMQLSLKPIKAWKLKNFAALKLDLTKKNTVRSIGGLESCQVYILGDVIEELVQTGP